MRSIVTLVSAGVLSAACAVGPNYKRPPVTVPERFHGQTAAAEAGSVADLPWWDVFQDQTLRSLVEEALRSGYDARIAAARVEEARARFGIARSAFHPQVDSQGGYARQREPEAVTPGGKAADNWAASVGASWELDVWGRIRRLNESARAEYLATEEGRRGVALSLLSDVASAYFELRELDEELEIAQRTATAFRDTYDLFNRRLEGGAASALETSRAEAALASVAAQIPLLEREVVARENQISLLLGRAPGPIPRGAALATRTVPPEIPAGLPSALLLRRPDLREAEQQLVAANANVGVARAAFFPTVSLTGVFGGQSPELSDLLDGGKTWSAGGGILGPLFHGGRIRKQYRVSVARSEQASLQYQRAVANALGEVSTSLATVQKLADAEKQRSRTVAADATAVRLANLRYESGLSAYFEVLDAMQQLLAAENTLAQTRRDRTLALVQLYKALGGGWQAEPGGDRS